MRNTRQHSSRIRQKVTIIVHLALLWPAALWLAWLVLSQVNFLYPEDYRLLDIPATIETYAPQNRHGKQNFIETDAQERARLFAAITRAINHNGQGLAQLHYFSPDGRDLGVFLTADEVTHLTDVSKVVDLGDKIGMISLFGWLGLVFLSIRNKSPLPSLRSFAIGTLATLFLVTVIVLIIGPMRVFNAFHRSVFPANHPWFFYYQDSLMTTFMQAPNLFGLIVIWWLFLASLLLLLLLGAAKGFIAYRYRQTGAGKQGANDY